MVPRRVPGRERVVHESGPGVHRRPASEPDSVDGLWTTPTETVNRAGG
jgi:hypothetical protein